MHLYNHLSNYTKIQYILSSFNNLCYQAPLQQGNVLHHGRFQKISIPIPRTAFRISEGEGGSLNWNSEGMGGIYDWKSEGMGGLHRGDFWSRKSRVSSLKTLLLWTFVVRK